MFNPGTNTLLSVQKAVCTRSLSPECHMFQPSLLRAMDIGHSTAQNVSWLKMVAPSVTPGSPAYFHAKHQQARDDVQEFGILAIENAVTASQMVKSICE